VQLHLDSVVTDIGEAEAGLAIHSQNSSANVELRTRVFIRPNVVEVVRGRFTDPATQSSVPRGWMETERAMY